MRSRSWVPASSGRRAAGTFSAAKRVWVSAGGDMEALHGRVDIRWPPLIVTRDEVRQLFAVDGRGYRQNIVVTKREAVCHLHHDFEVRGDLFPSAAGQKGDPLPGWVQAV